MGKQKNGLRHYPVKGYVGQDWEGYDVYATRQILKAVDREWEDEYEDGPECRVVCPRSKYHKRPKFDWNKWRRHQLQNLLNRGYDGSYPYPYSKPKE